LFPHANGVALIEYSS